MNAKSALGSAALLFLLAGSAHAQGLWTQVWRSLEIRQNTEIEDFVAKDATTQITFPDSGPNTIVIAAGALVDLIAGSRARLRAVGEYNRNTTIGKVQNAWQAGLKGEFLVPRILRGLDPVVDAAAKIAGDEVARTTALQSSASLTFTGDNRTCLPNTNIELSRSLPAFFVYSPYLGTEYDLKLSGAGPRHFLRGVARMDLAVRLGRSSAPILEFTGTNTFRRDFADQSVAGKNWSSFHTVSGTVYVPGVPDRVRVGLTMTRTWGEDPTRGFAHQAFSQLALAIRIKRAS